MTPHDMKQIHIAGDNTNKRINMDWFFDRIVRGRTVPIPGKPFGSPSFILYFIRTCMHAHTHTFIFLLFPSLLFFSPLLLLFSSPFSVFTYCCINSLTLTRQEILHPAHLRIATFIFTLISIHLHILKPLGDGTQLVALSHVDDVTNIIAAAVGNDKAFKQVSHTTAYRSTPHGTASHSLHYTTLHSITLYYASPLCTTLHYTALRHAILHYITLHYIALHHTTLPRHTILHHTALHHTTTIEWKVFSKPQPHFFNIELRNRIHQKISSHFLSLPFRTISCLLLHLGIQLRYW